MTQEQKPYRSMPIGVVVKRQPGVTRWAKYAWKATSILPGAGDAHWRELRREGDVVEFHAGTATLELFGAETEAYVHGLGAQVPCLYVIMRQMPGTPDTPFEILLVTASPYEAQDYCDTGEELVEKVAMTPGIEAWVRDFVELFHEDEEFVKRRRHRERVDKVEDGIGDPCIGGVGDVYASPALQRRRMQ